MRSDGIHDVASSYAPKHISQPIRHGVKQGIQTPAPPPPLVIGEFWKSCMDPSGYRYLFNDVKMNICDASVILVRAFCSGPLLIVFVANKHF